MASQPVSRMERANVEPPGAKRVAVAARQGLSYRNILASNVTDTLSSEALVIIQQIIQQHKTPVRHLLKAEKQAEVLSTLDSTAKVPSFIQGRLKHIKITLPAADKAKELEQQYNDKIDALRLELLSDVAAAAKAGVAVVQQQVTDSRAAAAVTFDTKFNALLAGSTYATDLEVQQAKTQWKKLLDLELCSLEAVMRQKQAPKEKPSPAATAPGTSAAAAAPEPPPGDMDADMPGNQEALQQQQQQHSPTAIAQQIRAELEVSIQQLTTAALAAELPKALRSLGLQPKAAARPQSRPRNAQHQRPSQPRQQQQQHRSYRSGRAVSASPSGRGSRNRSRSNSRVRFASQPSYIQQRHPNQKPPQQHRRRPKNGTAGYGGPRNTATGFRPTNTTSYNRSNRRNYH